MAVENYKMVLGFGADSIGSVPADGWTDVWYTTTDNPAAVQVRAKGYMDRRVSICNSVVRGVRFRVSIIPSNMLTFQQRYRPGPGPFPVPDTPWNALWLTVACASQGVRRQWLVRGMTDDYIVNGSWVPAGTAWQTNFNELVRYMKVEGQFALKLIDNSFLLKNLNSVTTDGLVTLPSGHGFAINDVVRFFRTAYNDRNLGKVKGDFTVTELVGSTGVRLNNWFPAGTVSRGKLRKIQYTYPLVSDIQIAGVRKRNVGRPLELLRGRVPRRSS